MSIKQADQRRLEALARYKSVEALERELAATEAVIQDYKGRIEEAEANGQQASGLKEMLEVWKREELEKQLQLKESNSDDGPLNFPFTRAECLKQ